MCHTITHRVRAIALSIGIAMSVVMIACRDSQSPETVERDDWSDAAVVSVQLQSELVALTGSRSIPMHTSSRLSKARVLPRIDNEPMQGVAFADQGRRKSIKHIKDSSGAIHSIVHFRDNRGLPERIFAFKNGVIQAIVSPTYVPHSKGYLKKRARTTWFYDGKPLVQTTEAVTNQVSASQSRQMLSGVLLAAREAASVLLPAPAHAELTELGCFSELTAYLMASAVVAAAATALIAAAPGCATVLPLAPPCLTALGFATGFLTAAAKWSEVLDKLLACERAEQERKKREGVIAEGSESDGESDGSGSLEQEAGATRSLNRIIEEFLEKAIASGQYFCTDDGDACVFYGT